MPLDVPPLTLHPCQQCILLHCALCFPSSTHMHPPTTVMPAAIYAPLCALPSGVLMDVDCTWTLKPIAQTCYHCCQTDHGPKTVMRALEMSVASLRLWPTWLMRWLATESGTHRVQHTLGDFSGCRGADGAVHWGGFAPLGGRGGGIDSPMFGVFGFSRCWVHSPSIPLFFFSDPSTSVFGSL
jgi:hypothetical protein